MSADTRVNSVLGYSLNGNFDKNNVPENMNGWLNTYSSQIEYAINKMPESVNIPTYSRIPSQTNSVLPLLGEIKWNQNEPYNNLCPLDGTKRSFTGCVATVMAQIMKYHRHPQTGKGGKTYTTRTLGKTLSVDFSTAVYDWDNMQPTYNALSSDVQKNAVATLMYHAGVSVEMDYRADYSDSNTTDAAIALQEYFDYDAGIEELRRDLYSAAEWKQIIKKELDESRPLIVAGYGDYGGHAFVCDGYDVDGFVHINWGWGGYQDGYFQLSAFDPEGVGIGGGSGGYNTNQSIVIGIQKPKDGSVRNVVLGVGNISTDKAFITTTETADFVLNNMLARSLYGYKGKFGLGVYDETGNLVKVIREGNIDITFKTLIPDFTFYAVEYSEIRTDASPAGNYYIKAVYLPQDSVEWLPAIVAFGCSPYIQAEISETGIRFSSMEMKFKLEQTGPATVKNAPYTICNGRRLNVDLQLTNTGNVEYRAQIGIKAISKSDETKIYNFSNVKCILPVGETTSVNLWGLIDLPLGEYRFELYFDPANKADDFNFPSQKIESSLPSTSFTVVEAPAPYQVSLTKATEMPSEIVQGIPFTFKASVNNTGGLFAHNLQLVIYKNRNYGSNMYDLVLNAKPFYAEIFTETKTFDIAYTLDLPPSDGYAAILFYQEEGKPAAPFTWDIMNWRFFKIKPQAPTGISYPESDNTLMSIYPNPAKKFVNVKLISESKADKVVLFDVTGKMLSETKILCSETIIDVQSLPAGIYFLKVGSGVEKLVVE